MTYTTLLVAIGDGVATVTVNRPDKLNALNAECKREMKDLFTALGRDDAVRAVILTGSGPKAFMAGTDIAELSRMDSRTGTALSREGQALFDLIRNLGKPVIAAVNGYALGGGCELALACHIRIASENARFGQPEVTLGTMPGYGGTQRLARLVGPGRAAELILTGRQVDAREALEIGLVNRVVPAGDLLGEAATVAAAICTMGPVAVRMSLEALNAADELPLSEGLKLEARLFGGLCDTDDFREGTAAFLGKRKASFQGK